MNKDTLQNDAIYTLALQDGTKRDAAWESDERRFRLCDGMGDGYVQPDEVYEWWPAGVRF